MTIGGWVLFIVLAIAMAGATLVIFMNCYTTGWKIATIAICALLIAGLFAGEWYYFNRTASGIRAFTDEKSEIHNGLEREINVYTADGNLIAHYEGKIDLEDNAGGYVIFDWNGKRYTYYNCFVESIAEIE